MSALRWVLKKDIPPLQKAFLKDVLRFCLTHTYFWYGGRFYLQCTDVDMGAKIAPNLFKAECEEMNRKPKLLFYKRFIDGLFMTWAETELNSNA